MTSGYDASLYEAIARAEPESFWFRARNRLVVSTLRRHFPGAGSLLELGCGTGFVLEEKGIPRHGYPVRTPGGGGTVTSGNISPMLDTGIGLAYVSPPPSGADIEVQIRDRWVPGRVAEPPFHREKK